MSDSLSNNFTFISFSTNVFEFWLKVGELYFENGK